MGRIAGDYSLNSYDYDRGGMEFDGTNDFGDVRTLTQKKKGFDFNSALDKVQDGLSIAGFIPGLGAIPDLVNAGIYGLRGKPVEAGISAVSAIPGIGDLAGAGRMAGKGLRKIGLLS